MSRTPRQQNIFVQSGEFASSDALVCFLYLLMRDHLPSGVVVKIVEESSGGCGESTYTNGWQAQHAASLATALVEPDVAKLRNFEERLRLARETNTRLNRRCQVYESALAEKIEKARAKHNSLGRALANAAAVKAEATATASVEAERSRCVGICRQVATEFATSAHAAADVAGRSSAAMGKRVAEMCAARINDDNEKNGGE